jgi:hypothetical protein
MTTTPPTEPVEEPAPDLVVGAVKRIERTEKFEVDVLEVV